MQAKRLLLLLVLVTGLGLLAWRVGESEIAPQVLGSRKLAPQIESSRITKLVVDRPATSDRFDIERDARGTWLLTEPVVWQAESGIVRGLVDNIRNLPAEVIEGIDEVEAELSPGLIRLEITERVGDRDKHWLVRVGRLDLGEDRVFCAVSELDANGEPVATEQGPQILRVPRPIFDTPMMGYDHFRSRRLVEFEPTQVIAIRRRGAGSQSLGSARIRPIDGTGSGRNPSSACRRSDAGRAGFVDPVRSRPARRSRRVH